MCSGMVPLLGAPAERIGRQVSFFHLAQVSNGNRFLLNSCLKSKEISKSLLLSFDERRLIATESLYQKVASRNFAAKENRQGASGPS